MAYHSGITVHRRRIGASKIFGTVRGVRGAGTKILATADEYLPHRPQLPASGPERLIVFSRWPMPGKTKTRLIPELGPLRAAELQRRMTEQTVRTARAWATADRRDVEVRHEGGSWRQMRRWLGPGVRYRRQNQDDLGRRMASAFRTAFGEGAQRVVLIGTDCPGVTAELLDEAASALSRHDLVLGPTHDGGYWLIGMKRPLPVFDGVPWSSEAVLEHTLKLADRRGLSVCRLPKLSDIDTPDDLRHASELSDPHRPVISVIIPALNESESIDATLRSASASGVEIIMADGGSTDGTAERAAALGAAVVHSPPGRAGQQNAGAAVAIADILLFLHADTVLPDGWQSDVFEAMLDASAVGGGVRLEYRPGQPVAADRTILRSAADGLRPRTLGRPGDLRAARRLRSDGRLSGCRHRRGQGPRAGVAETWTYSGHPQRRSHLRPAMEANRGSPRPPDQLAGHPGMPTRRWPRLAAPALLTQGLQAKVASIPGIQPPIEKRKYVKHPANCRKIPLSGGFLYHRGPSPTVAASDSASLSPPAAPGEMLIGRLRIMPAGKGVCY